MHPELPGTVLTLLSGPEEAAMALDDDEVDLLSAINESLDRRTHFVSAVEEHIADLEAQIRELREALIREAVRRADATIVLNRAKPAPARRRRRARKSVAS